MLNLENHFFFFFFFSAFPCLWITMVWSSDVRAKASGYLARMVNIVLGVLVNIGYYG